MRDRRETRETRGHREFRGIRDRRDRKETRETREARERREPPQWSVQVPVRSMQISTGGSRCDGALTLRPGILAKPSILEKVSAMPANRLPSHASLQGRWMFCRSSAPQNSLSPSIETTPLMGVRAFITSLWGTNFGHPFLSHFSSRLLPGVRYRVYRIRFEVPPLIYLNTAFTQTSVFLAGFWKFSYTPQVNEINTTPVTKTYRRFDPQNSAPQGK